MSVRTLLSTVVLIGCVGLLIKDSGLDKRGSRQLVQTVSLPPTPPAPILAPDAVSQAINTYRTDRGLKPLNPGKQTCQLLDLYQQQNQLDEAAITAACPTCQKLQINTLPAFTSAAALNHFFDSETDSEITYPNLTHFCLRQQDDHYIIATVMSVALKPTPAPAATRSISEDELWQALVEYRQAQRRTDLVHDEKLCVYARKRVNDHIVMLNQNKPKIDYPDQDKYPLDAHAGFRQDADSGLVFDMTGKQVVAENLAYWPNAKYATHVIEWGWDTSTEGHRETQVSNYYNSACLSGKNGFFVAIFGK